MFISVYINPNVCSEILLDLKPIFSDSLREDHFPSLNYKICVQEYILLKLEYSGINL